MRFARQAFTGTTQKRFRDKSKKEKEEILFCQKKKKKKLFYFKIYFILKTF